MGPLRSHFCICWLKQIYFIMKKTKVFGLVAAALTMGFVACNNDSDNTATTDTATSTTENTATTTTTSTTDYAALADSFRVNSEAGVYLNPRTGKSIRIKVDPQTGLRTDATTGEPVWRYIDKRTWWVYGGDSWDTMGEARMDGNNLMYKGDDGTWMTYDKRWPNDEQMMNEWKTKYSDGTKVEVQENGNTKTKDENMKVKTEKDGDVKIKTQDGKKIKKDEDGTVIKNDNK